MGRHWRKRRRFRSDVVRARLANDFLWKSLIGASGKVVGLFKLWLEQALDDS